jgi:chromosome segregation protein
MAGAHVQITRLRLLGFKSFVEPTELVIEKGLTGVVGPNGCGKSNLLEALRWVMGETSYKSMRASAMEDVIFSGTNARPARNMAEVTISIDNAARTAPAELNDADILEVTRRIERDAGSAYRVNGGEVRQRDIKLLFEDAATGARSPALVRQGQISEIVNAKPEQRRRILEDAAGIAGLHSRRHEAELRLKAAEGNLARASVPSRWRPRRSPVSSSRRPSARLPSNRCGKRRPGVVPRSPASASSRRRLKKKPSVSPTASAS